MLCHLYSFASFVMCFMFSYPFVDSFINSVDNSSVYTNTTNTINTNIINNNTNQSQNFQTINRDEFNITDELDLSTGSSNITDGEDLSASSSELLTWIRSSNGEEGREGSVKSVDNDSANTDSIPVLMNNQNTSLSLKKLLDFFNKNSNKREDTDLGLPPDIAHEYIDAVNPPKFKIPVQYGNHQYITSSVVPIAPPYDNRLHAGSSVVKSKANYTSPLRPKPNDSLRTGSVDLQTLLKAELDAKNEELDKSKFFTTAPNLFALLPGKESNPFLESNYKTPNRPKSSTSRPYITSDNSVNYIPNNVKQFVYGEGLPSIRVTVPNRPTLAITTPNSISLISTSTPTKLIMLRASSMKTTTTARPVQYSKMKIRTTASPGSSNSSPSTTKSTSMPTKPPTVDMSTTIANNKSHDWSSRVSNHTTDRSSDANDSRDIRHPIERVRDHIERVRDDPGMHLHESYDNENIIFRSNKNKNISEDYRTESNANKTDYNDFDYADNTALNPNYTVPDGFADYPGANYRLTTERLAYILIGSCCALSILCLIVVAMSVRCRDMCDEYRSWKKAEKAALRWQRHQYRLANHRQDLSRYFRTSVEPNHESNVRTGQMGNGINGIAAPAPLFGPTCCHCISCSSSWLFRDVNKAGRDWCCQRGYYHPAPRGKLPFGAASTVNTFMPRYANNANNNSNCCDEQSGDTDSLNTSDLMERDQNRQQRHFGNCPATNTRTEQTSRRQQLRRIAQPNPNHQNWIHSSEMVDELHKKHSNVNNVSRDEPNLNNFRARNRQIGNENIVVWNNNNDERLI